MRGNSRELIVPREGGTRLCGFRIRPTSMSSGIPAPNAPVGVLGRRGAGIVHSGHAAPSRRRGGQACCCPSRSGEETRIVDSGGFMAVRHPVIWSTSSVGPVETLGPNRQPLHPPVPSLTAFARTVRVRTCLHRAYFVIACCKLRTASLQAISGRRKSAQPARTDLKSSAPRRCGAGRTLLPTEADPGWLTLRGRKGGLV